MGCSDMECSICDVVECPEHPQYVDDIWAGMSDFQKADIAEHVGRRLIEAEEEIL